MVSTEPGPRIVLVQLVCGLLSGISITTLQDAYGPFTHTINLAELIVVEFIPPVEDFPAQFIPLGFEDSFVQIHV
jgi:hypothetical protein